MKRLALVCRIGFLAFFLAGCATNIQPVTDSTTPVKGFGFSILPPNGQHWYMTNDYSNQAIFFGMMTPEFSKQGGSVVVGALRMKARKHDIRSLEGLRLEVDDYVHTYSNRQTLVSSTIEPYQDKDLRTDCVRVEAVSQERNNSNHPGKVLLLTANGKICRYPSNPEYFVHVAYSERRIIDTPKLIDEALRKECEYSVNSLKFLSD